MSKETAEWLNTQTLIGFTEKRGNAWHYQEALQGGEPNHYPGAIPVGDVERRLFDWEAESESVYVLRNGVPVAIPNKQAVSVNEGGVLGDVLGVFSEIYRPHQYKPWLLDNVGKILDDGELSIGSAGQLKNRAQAWVSVEVPENIETPEGVTFRPNLIACTSFDGSLATTYKRTATVVVCDNTLRAGLNSDGGLFRLKHTSNSLDRIADAREALEIVYSTADEFSAEVARLCATEVSDEVWNKLVNVISPLPEEKGRSRTLALNKQDALFDLYRSDDRVAPWAGTAFGVLQATNTYAHHIKSVRGASVTQRNREAALTGSIAKEDAKVLGELEKLLVAV
jgi:phage/plasmid-like protein (TIGR03299 family)